MSTLALILMFLGTTSSLFSQLSVLTSPSLPISHSVQVMANEEPTMEQRWANSDSDSNALPPEMYLKPPLEEIRFIEFIMGYMFNYLSPTLLIDESFPGKLSPIACGRVRV